MRVEFGHLSRDEQEPNFTNGACSADSETLPDRELTEIIRFKDINFRSESSGMATTVSDESCTAVVSISKS